jgi:hypothetical protein
LSESSSLEARIWKHLFLSEIVRFPMASIFAKREGRKIFFTKNSSRKEKEEMRVFWSLLKNKLILNNLYSVSGILIITQVL